MSDIPNETKPQELSTTTDDNELKNISAIQGFMEKYRAEQTNDLANDLGKFKDRPKPPYVEVDPAEVKEISKSIEKHRLIADHHAQKVLDSRIKENQDWQKSIGFIQKENNYSVYETMETLDSFKSPPEVVTLNEPFIGFRRWGGGAGERSRWLACNLYDPEEHINRYDLPSSNNAQYTAAWKVDAGTRVLQGPTDSKFGHEGGGDQVFIPNEELLKPVSLEDVIKEGR
jgi:hypothetical protein